MKNLSPIALFTYNRLDKTIQTVNSLKKNNLSKDTVLYIFSDGPKKGQEKKVSEVRSFLYTISGFKKIIIFERKKNFGLAKSIIFGVNKILKKHTEVIVVEDDLLLSKQFLLFMNSALDFYKTFPTVFSISGYSPPVNSKKIPPWYDYDVYFNPVPSSWGWATWKDKWDKACWEKSDYSDFFRKKQLVNKFNRMGNWLSDLLILQNKGLVDSWAIRWAFTHFKYGAHSIFPIKSFVFNGGLDGSGVHCASMDELNSFDLNNKKNYIFMPVVVEEDFFINNYKRVFSKKLTFPKLKRFIKVKLKFFLK